MNLLRKLNRVPVKLYNPETLSWRDRAIASGGIVSDATLDAVERFVLECKNGAIWDKFIEVGPFAGGNLAAALTKLVYPGGGSGTLTNGNFVSGDYTESTGLLGDGLTKFLTTSVNMQSLPDTHHFSFYLREDVSASGNRMMMGVLGGTDHYWMGSLTPATGADVRLGGTVTSSIAGGFTKGFYAGVRASTASLRFSRNGMVLDSSSSATTVTKPSLLIQLWAYNANGSPGAPLPARGSFYSIGQPLTDAETSILHTAVRNLQTALNRAVV